MCARFDGLLWHDSELLELHLMNDVEGGKYDLRLDLNLYEKNLEGKFAKYRRSVLFIDCRIVQTDLDLLGVMLCSRHIADANCRREVIAYESENRGKLRDFDLPQKHKPLEDCMVFHIEMIHPGGEIVIYAKNFEIV